MTREQIMKRCKELDPIWQAMKKGKMCKLWDDYHDRGKIGYLTGIDFSSVLPYETDGMWYKHAEPIEPVQPIEPVLRVKDPVSLMRALVDAGYVCDENGKFTHKTKMYFLPKMWQFCGQAVTTHTGFEWLPEWLEEVYE